MKSFLFILILAALFQTSFLPINLCLILLICRSYAVSEKQNLYLGLFCGIILGILSPVNLGFWPLVFLIVIYLTQLIRKLPITASYLTIIPVTFLFVIIVTCLESLVFHQKINFYLGLTESLLSLPIFILIKIWEDRFMPRTEIKLKIKG